MEDLVLKLLEGIDPNDPNLTWLIFSRLMGLVDWWLLVWLTLGCAVVGGLIGWRRGSFWRDFALGAALGPIGWIVSVIWRPGQPRRCIACGFPVRGIGGFCANCGTSLPPPIAAKRG